MNIMNIISPYKELLSYEYLWAQNNSTLKKISELFDNNQLPSQIVEDSKTLFYDNS